MLTAVLGEDRDAKPLNWDYNGKGLEAQADYLLLDVLGDSVHRAPN